MLRCDGIEFAEFLSNFLGLLNNRTSMIMDANRRE